MKPIKSYKDLEIWQEGIQLISTVYKSTSTFPRDELYGLTSQMRRAAVSTPTNIAEGYTRNHRAELRQFLYISLGSLAEVETLVVVSVQLGYVDQRRASVELEQPLTQLHHRILAFLRCLR